jgi:hypothetical protein
MTQAPGKRTTMSRTGRTGAKRTAVRLPYALMPHACSVLGIDGAKRTGWALRTWGRLVTYGECDAYGDEPQEILRRLLQLPGPHVVAIERPFLIRFGGQAGLGAAEKLWRELAARVRPKLTIVRVYPATWRARVLPKGMHAAARDDVQREEHATARLDVIADCGPNITPQAPRIGTESAPAILISRWASYAGETLAAMAKQSKKRKGAAA